MARIGVESHRSHAHRSYTTGEQWVHTDRPFGPRAVASALAGRYALDARGLTRCSVGIFDVDTGHVDPATLPSVIVCDCPPGGNAIDRWMSCPHRRRDSHAARVRAHAIDRARPIITALQRACAARQATLHVEASTRGVHAFVVFDRAHAPADIRAYMIEILTDAGLDLADRTVEVFPALREDDTGDLCRLPLCGQSARLLDDRLDRAHRRRRADLAKVLAAPLTTLHLVHVERAPAHDRKPVSGPATASQDGDYPHVCGAEYVDQVLDLIEQGIPAHCSKVATEKVAFAARVGMALSPSDTIAIVEAVLSQPHHACEASQSDSARRAAIRRTRSYLRHLDRGIACGDLVPGKLQSRDLSGALSALLDGAPLPARRQRARARDARQSAEDEHIARVERRKLAGQHAARARWSRHNNPRGTPPCVDTQPSASAPSTTPTHAAQHPSPSHGTHSASTNARSPSGAPTTSPRSTPSYAQSSARSEHAADASDLASRLPAAASQAASPPFSAPTAEPDGRAGHAPSHAPPPHPRSVGSPTSARRIHVRCVLRPPSPQHVEACS